MSTNQRKPLPWVQEMTEKFTAIGIITRSDLVAVITLSVSINTILKEKGLKTLHLTRRLGLDAVITSNNNNALPAPPNLDVHLRQEAELIRIFIIVGETLGTANVEGWVKAIINKLCCIGITYSSQVHLAIITGNLNRNLRLHGFSPFYLLTHFIGASYAYLMFHKGTRMAISKRRGSGLLNSMNCLVIIYLLELWMINTPSRSF